MRHAACAFALLGLVAAPAGAQAPAAPRPIVLVLDVGQSQVSVPRLTRVVSERLARPLVRLTDPEAEQAEGRLTIAFGPPDRWVLRFESGGPAAVAHDRVGQARLILPRLAELAAAVVSAGRDNRARSDWQDDDYVARASREDEIVDPFTPPVPRPRRRRDSYRPWSELIDPFDEHPRQRHAELVWSEVINPWAEDER